MAEHLPSLMTGNRVTDDRGSLAFANNLCLDRVKRFYTVTNHECGFIRAWHAHRNESKYVVPILGTVIVAAIPIEELEKIEKDDTLKENARYIRSNALTRIVLTADNPSVLWIPHGYGNGFKTLTPNAIVMFFSDKTLQDSHGDDIRFSADYYREQAFHVEER